MRVCVRRRSLRSAHGESELAESVGCGSCPGRSWVSLCFGTALCVRLVAGRIREGGHPNRNCSGINRQCHSENKKLNIEFREQGQLILWQVDVLILSIWR